jgi:energy-coupling factor transporter transmembrane protein EcfT
MITLCTSLFIFILLFQYIVILIFLVRIKEFFETKLELKVALIPIVPVLLVVIIGIAVLILDKDARNELGDIVNKLK